VLKVWAVREALVEMVVQRPAAELAAGPFYCLTAALVLAAYLVSVLVPSIYVSGAPAGGQPPPTECALWGHGACSGQPA
jgi:hypothetical protein